MSLSGLFSVLEQYTGANTASPPANTQQDFQQVAQSAEPSHLATGISQAFQSSETPAFPEMVKNLFSQSNGQQKAGLLNHLLGSAGASGIGSELAGLLGGAAGGGNPVTPQQADQVSPEAVQHLAEKAHQANPSIVDEVSGFYSQHPQVVQALGAGALAMIMSHMSRR